MPITKKITTEELILLIVKNTNKLVQQIQTKAQETSNPIKTVKRTFFIWFTFTIANWWADGRSDKFKSTYWLFRITNKNNNIWDE